jgi:glyoxylase-like metal-dependent hydrolase (beta-lactamase superfamily II)
MPRIEREPYLIDNWFEIEKLNNDVYAIGEPKHREEVFCYLVKGTQKDILIDTGMGIKPITHALESIRNSSKELIVVNSHFHFDHIGGNSQFDKVLVPKNNDEIEGIKKGWSNLELNKYSFFDQFHSGGESTIPLEFDIENFFIPGYEKIDPILIDGYFINLGDRIIRVIETPGHTNGGVCFFDQTN